MQLIQFHLVVMQLNMVNVRVLSQNSAMLALYYIDVIIADVQVLVDVVLAVNVRLL